MTTATTFETYRQNRDRVLGRCSVTDLVEQTSDDLARGDELFYASGKAIEIVGEGEANMIRWWRIRSDEAEYEVRRFKNFVWCSCKSFYFSRRCCKHIAITTGVACERCHVLRARKGKLCYDCDQTVNKFNTKGKTQ